MGCTVATQKLQRRREFSLRLLVDGLKGQLSSQGGAVGQPADDANIAAAGAAGSDFKLIGLPLGAVGVNKDHGLDTTGFEAVRLGSIDADCLGADDGESCVGVGGAYGDDAVTAVHRIRIELAAAQRKEGTER